MRLWETQRAALTAFNIEKPLWVFVGNKVSDDDSDILTVVRFLADFLNHGSRTLGWIADLIADRAQIVDERSKKNIFEKRFLPLMGEGAEAIYADILKRLFNANGAQRLKLVNVKNSKGELALRVGDAAPFGLINIGDDSGFFTLAEEQRGGAFDLEEDSFGGALFGTINAKDSRLNVLIGSRKFTEGWSSWRVSTMGLLNMGQGEGSQIIQLFGRGVRLKGRGFSLKRTPKGELPKGLHLEKLETLNIFGVRADYMAKFKDYLREEGITPTDEILELDFPTRANLPAKSLKTLRLKDGYKDNQKHGFKRNHYPSLYETPPAFIDAETGRSKIKTPHVVVDLYPRIQALASGEARGTTKPKDARQTGKLATEAMRFFDWDRIFLAVQEHKLLSGWSNLRVDCDRLKTFCLGDAGWYTLYVPASELVIRRMEDVRKQEDILIQLLTDFTERYYQALKNAYEGEFYEVISLAADTARCSSSTTSKSRTPTTATPTCNGSKPYKKSSRRVKSERRVSGRQTRWSRSVSTVTFTIRYCTWRPRTRCHSRCARSPLTAKAKFVSCAIWRPFTAPRQAKKPSEAAVSTSSATPRPRTKASASPRRATFTPTSCSGWWTRRLESSG